MIKEIVKDVKFLSQVSQDFDFDKDKEILKDLRDTAKAHKENCAGLASVQIGQLKRCFVAKDYKTNSFVTFINPEIKGRSSKTYIANEGCLSLEGTRSVVRNDWIIISYTNSKNERVTERLQGPFAEIVQHEYDHLEGKLI